MTNKGSTHNEPRPRGISRREFIMQLAALAGLLAACAPSNTEQPATPTTAPPATPALTAPPPTAAPTASPAHGVLRTATPTLQPVPPRPTDVPIREVIKFYPDAPSRVVHTRHSGVWSDDKLVPGALRQMLDASITKLTGLNDAQESWAALFRPGERIAIKVNTIAGSRAWTHVPLVTAVTACLQGAGIPADQITIFDRHNYELSNAGYTINKDGPGVRCYGTDNHPGRYVRSWKVMDSRRSTTHALGRPSSS